MAGFDPIIAGVTLGGSLLSAIASFCVLGCFVLFNKNQRSFRHALVFNLALSDFINATCNSVSGAIYVRDKQLYPGPSCAFSGWLNQLSVQATDISVLAISMATLLVVTQRGRVADASTQTKTILCLSIWIMPLITSTTALGMGEIKPVSGNWCWISASRTDLRYALTHGWRFAIMAITIFTYTYIWWYLTRHFKLLKNVSMGRSCDLPSTIPEHTSSASLIPSWKKKKRTASDASSDPSDSFELGQTQRIGVYHDAEKAQGPEHHENACLPASDLHGITATTTITTITAPTNQFQAHSQKVERDIKKMLLLNGYPICYVILWIPGITNRIMEASGNTSNKRVLNILQASTQFIGFANAVTYGLNQQWRGR